MSYFKKLGKVIAERRTQLSMSQEELAEKAGLHRTYITDIECGTRNMSMRTLVKVATALSVVASDLLKLAEKL